MSPPQDTLTKQGPVLAEQDPNELGCDQIGEMFAFQVHLVAPGEAGGNSIPTNMSYRAFIGETVPYELDKDCVCKTQFIRLIFENLPPANDIVVTNTAGQELTFVGPYNYNSSTMNGMAIHLGQNQLASDMYIGFDTGSPAPERLGSGGYCIVDNISAPVHTGLRTTAYEEEQFDPTTLLPYIAVFVPQAGTFPVPN